MRAAHRIGQAFGVKASSLRRADNYVADGCPVDWHGRKITPALLVRWHEAPAPGSDEALRNAAFAADKATHAAEAEALLSVAAKEYSKAAGALLGSAYARQLFDGVAASMRDALVEIAEAHGLGAVFECELRCRAPESVETLESRCARQEAEIVALREQLSTRE
jgi:hypothetical protein